MNPASSNKPPETTRGDTHQHDTTEFLLGPLKNISGLSIEHCLTLVLRVSASGGKGLARTRDGCMDIPLLRDIEAFFLGLLMNILGLNILTMSDPGASGKEWQGPETAAWIFEPFMQIWWHMPSHDWYSHFPWQILYLSIIWAFYANMVTYAQPRLILTLSLTNGSYSLFLNQIKMQTKVWRKKKRRKQKRKVGRGQAEKRVEGDMGSA